MKASGGRLRRWRRACFIGAGSAVAIAISAPALAQEAPPPIIALPSGYVGAASAFAIQGNINLEPPAVIPELFKPSIPFATATFESGGQSKAEADLADPGILLNGGLSLVCLAGVPCGDIPFPFPPAYPLAAKAEYPTAEDGVATINGGQLGGGLFVIKAGDAKAHADIDDATASADLQNVTIGPLPADLGLLRVGSVTADSSVKFDRSGTLVSSAHSSLHDVTILTALHIGEIETTSISRASVDGTVDNDVSINISGANIGGIPVGITEKGISFGEPLDGGLLGTIGTLLNDTLKPLGGTVRLLGTSDTTDDGNAKGEAVGLLVTIIPNLQQIPSVPTGVGVRADLVLGAASSSAYVVANEPFDTAPEPDTALPVVSDFPPFDTGASFVPTTEVAAPPAAPAPRRTNFITRLLGGLAADRLKFFYLAWTLSMIGLALGSRLNPLRLVIPTRGGNGGSPT